jgi:hypothetical protein
MVVSAVKIWQYIILWYYNIIVITMILCYITITIAIMICYIIAGPQLLPLALPIQCGKLIFLICIALHLQV